MRKSKESDGLKLYAIKVGMRTIRLEGTNDFFACSDMKLCPNTLVTQRKNEEKEGDLILTKRKRLKKPQLMELKANGFEGKWAVRTVRDAHLSTSDRNILAKSYRKVRVRGLSKGKGFQGTIKRWGFKQQPASHGSKNQRRQGSIGVIKGKVWKGTKMPGRMGGKNVTVSDLNLISINDDILTVKGSVPGPRKAMLELTLYNSILNDE